MAGVSYASLEQIKAHLESAAWGTQFDAILTTLASRASREIDSYLKRSPGAFAVSTDTVRFYDGSGGAELLIDELAAAPTEIAVDEGGSLSYTVWSTSDYRMRPYNAPAEGIPYTAVVINTLTGSKSTWYSYPQAVRITGKFGFSTTAPDEIVEATIIQTVRWFTRGRQAFQDAGAIQELGRLKFVQKLDPDVQTLIELPRFQRVTI